MVGVLTSILEPVRSHCSGRPVGLVPEIAASLRNNKGLAVVVFWGRQTEGRYKNRSGWQAWAMFKVWSLNPKNLLTSQ